MRPSVACLTLGLLFTSLACRPEDDDDQSAAAVAAIERIHSQRVEAFEAGDVDGWFALIADDPVFMPMQAPAVDSRDQLRSFYENWFSTTDIELEDITDEIVVRDDLAFVRGRVVITEIAKAEGARRTDHRKYIEIFQQAEDGEWKYWRVILNGDGAAGAS